MANGIDLHVLIENYHDDFCLMYLRKVVLCFQNKVLSWVLHKEPVINKTLST